MSTSFEAMIFAAGRGVRLGEIGTAIPKAILPVWKDNDILEPIVIRVIRQIALAGAQTIRLAINYQGEHIKNIVRRSESLKGLSIEFVEQPILNGEAGGLFDFQKTGLPILAVDVDNYLSDDTFLKKLVEHHFLHKYTATIGVNEVPDISRYANVRMSESNTVISIIEKPKQSESFGNLAKMGCYMLTAELIERGPDFFKDSQNELTTTAAFSKLCSLGHDIGCLLYKGDYLDIGNINSYSSHLKLELKSR